MATRGFRVVQGAWVYAPEGGRVDTSISAPLMPSDSSELDKLAAAHGMPVAVIRQAFGTLPPSSSVPVETPENAPTAPVSAAEDAVVADDAPVEEEAPKAPDKPKKQKKAKKASE